MAISRIAADVGTTSYAGNAAIDSMVRRTGRLINMVVVISSVAIMSNVFEHVLKELADSVVHMNVMGNAAKQ